MSGNAAEQPSQHAGDPSASATFISLGLAGLGLTGLWLMDDAHIKDRLRSMLAILYDGSGRIDRAVRVEKQAEAIVAKHPLASSVTMLALGVAIGWAMPRSALEGASRDRDRLPNMARRWVQGMLPNSGPARAMS